MAKTVKKSVKYRAQGDPDGSLNIMFLAAPKLTDSDKLRIAKMQIEELNKKLYAITGRNDWIKGTVFNEEQV